MSKRNFLEYKGYHTEIIFDSEDFVLRGKIEGINDFVNFENANAEEIENEFHQAVDDYLEFCKAMGKEPEKEYRGSFNVRVSPDLHRDAVMVAAWEGCSLNAIVDNALREYVRITKQKYIQKNSGDIFEEKSIISIQGENISNDKNVYSFEEHKKTKMVEALEV